MASPTLADRPSARHRLLPEKASAMARVTSPESGESLDWREEIGRAIHRAQLLRGWSLKELAAAVGRDERQVARWMSGAERPHFDALFAVDGLRHDMVLALAERAGDDIAIETTIRIARRRA